MAFEKILVVDDSPTELNLIVAPLKNKGYGFEFEEKHRQ